MQKEKTEQDFCVIAFAYSHLDLTKILVYDFSELISEYPLRILFNERLQIFDRYKVIWDTGHILAFRRTLIPKTHTMLWIIVAIIGYFLTAVATILDKYILSAKISHPSVYAFFVSVFSLFALAAAPFGVHFLSPQMLSVALLSGAFFVYGLIFFYKAIQENAISKVAPLMGTLSALFALAYSLIVRQTEASALAASTPELLGYSYSMVAFWLLLVGGFLITFDLPLKKKEVLTSIANTTMASLLLTISLILLKNVYASDGFISGFMWSRVGLFLGGLSLFAVPIFREQITASFKGGTRTQEDKRARRSTGVWFVTNKVVAAVGSFCIQYAIALGSLVVVQALSGVQFAFVFLLAIPLSFRFPKLFGEKLLLNDWVQKIAALILIGLGVYFSAHSGTELFL